MREAVTAGRDPHFDIPTPAEGQRKADSPGGAGARSPSLDPHAQRGGVVRGQSTGSSQAADGGGHLGAPSSSVAALFGECEYCGVALVDEDVEVELDDYVVSVVAVVCRGCGPVKVDGEAIVVEWRRESTCSAGVAQVLDEHEQVQALDRAWPVLQERLGLHGG